VTRFTCGEAVARIAVELSQAMANQSFLVVKAEPYYVQFAHEGDDGYSVFEAVGDEYLPSYQHLSPSQVRRLAELGFVLGDAGNYVCMVALRSAPDYVTAAQTAVDILAEVYGCLLSDGTLNLDLE